MLIPLRNRLDNKNCVAQGAALGVSVNPVGVKPLRAFASAAGTAILLLGVWASVARSQSDANETPAQRGKKQFAQSCGFCHGPDATGARGPDLVRSALVAHDQKGELIGEVVRNGRVDKGMPALPLAADQISDITAFLHARAKEALESSGVPRDYPVERLLTGNAEAGKAYFEGPGGCAKCHSASGDLAGVAKKYSSIELEAHMLYPDYPEGKEPKRTAVVTLPSGEQVRGELKHQDDFMIGLKSEAGWYRSFDRGKVKVEIQDPLEGHRKLLDKLTQSDMHNLYAYVHSL
jgi:cytochrome c oxidase cbb3-type subunit 3